MKKFIFKILTWFALRCRLYYFWSRVYRWLWERKYRKIVLKEYDDIHQVEFDTLKMRWRRDTWLMLWDAVSLPQATWARHISGKKAGDCDDISLWSINRLHDVIRRNGGMLTGEDSFMSADLQSFGLLSVPFLRDGKLAGHNVGVFRYRAPGEPWLWAVVSNWYTGLVRYGFQSLDAVVEDVLSGEYGLYDPKAESLGWAYADLDLRLKEYRWKHKLIS